MIMVTQTVIKVELPPLASNKAILLDNAKLHPQIFILLPQILNQKKSFALGVMSNYYPLLALPQHKAESLMGSLCLLLFWLKRHAAKNNRLL